MLLLDDDGDDAVVKDTTRQKKIKYDHARAENNIRVDWLDANCRFNGIQFKQMFRVSRPAFEIIAQTLCHASTFFPQRMDACGEIGMCVAAKIMISLKSLAYGCSPLAFRDQYQMSEASADKCLEQFCGVFRRSFQDFFLRVPTSADLKCIVKLHRWKHQVEGMIGSLDVSQIQWDMCKKSLHGQFQGKEKIRTVALEAVADHNLWFWHASFGYPGSLNDLNVLGLSPLIEKMTHELLLLERECVPYSISGENFEKLFLLVDGIYPTWSRFVKTVGFPVTPMQKAFSAWQESVRKDIERAFGVLKKRFRVLKNGVRAHILERINDQVITCVILHNMQVAERVSGNIFEYKPEDSIDTSTNVDELENIDGDEQPAPTFENMNAWLEAYLQKWNALCDPIEHVRLQQALIQHVWNNSLE